MISQPVGLLAVVTMQTLVILGLIAYVLRLLDRLSEFETRRPQSGSSGKSIASSDLAALSLALAKAVQPAGQTELRRGFPGDLPDRIRATPGTETPLN